MDQSKMIENLVKEIAQILKKEKAEAQTNTDYVEIHSNGSITPRNEPEGPDFVGNYQDNINNVAHDMKIADAQPELAQKLLPILLKHKTPRIILDICCRYKLFKFAEAFTILLNEGSETGVFLQLDDYDMLRKDMLITQSPLEGIYGSSHNNTEFHMCDKKKSRFVMDMDDIEKLIFWVYYIFPDKDHYPSVDFPQKLYAMCYSANMEKIEPYLNKYYEYIEEAYHWACQSGSVEMVKYLDTQINKWIISRLIYIKPNFPLQYEISSGQFYMNSCYFAGLSGSLEMYRKSTDGITDKRNYISVIIKGALYGGHISIVEKCIEDYPKLKERCKHGLEMKYHMLFGGNWKLCETYGGLTGYAISADKQQHIQQEGHIDIIRLVNEKK